MKILIIQQKMIGDVLTTSILFEAIKQKYPQAALHYVINSHTFPVVQSNTFIDKFHFVTPEMEKSKHKFYQFSKNLRNESFDVVIDVYSKIQTALISYLSSAKTTIGYHKNYTSFLYSHTVKRLNKPEHNASLAIENRMKLLEFLDIPFKEYHPKIFLNDSEIENAKIYLESENLSLTQPLYMIGVLGSNDRKTYPATYMAKLLDEIVQLQPNVQLLFNYIPSQKAEAKTIFDLCSDKTKDHIHFDVFSKNLREFLAITYHCNALLGNEGGANNMAKALGIRTFTIFSPYLDKKNWFGDTESKNHVAVHISDYLPYSTADRMKAKKQPKEYYLKFKPEYILSDLKSFLQSLG